jgi:hypothetical protein
MVKLMIDKVMYLIMCMMYMMYMMYMMCMGYMVCVGYMGYVGYVGCMGCMGCMGYMDVNLVQYCQNLKHDLMIQIKMILIQKQNHLLTHPHTYDALDIERSEPGIM